ncbi:MAG: flagellar protein FlaG [Candidatus Marinimicrobia bacterium]|nr:flagellar protein FlaG [Candidatus Neomarinimicrobiota bacterium]
MEINLNVNPINKQFDSNTEKINESTNSVEKQKEIAKNDNLDFSLKAEKTESKKQGIAEYVKKQDFSNAINSVNEYVEMFNNKVSFSIDEKSREIIHVYDNETGDLIRQIPPKEMIELVDKLEEIAGIIFNNKV